MGTVWPWLLGLTQPVGSMWWLPRKWAEQTLQPPRGLRDPAPPRAHGRVLWQPDPSTRAERYAGCTVVPTRIQAKLGQLALPGSGASPHCCSWNLAQDHGRPLGSEAGAGQPVWAPAQSLVPWLQQLATAAAGTRCTKAEWAEPGPLAPWEQLPGLAGLFHPSRKWKCSWNSSCHSCFYFISLFLK